MVTLLVFTGREREKLPGREGMVGTAPPHLTWGRLGGFIPARKRVAQKKPVPVLRDANQTRNCVECQPSQGWVPPLRVSWPAIDSERFSHTTFKLLPWEIINIMIITHGIWPMMVLCKNSISPNPHNTMTWVSFLSPFCRWGNWASGTVHPVCWASAEIRAFSVPSPCSPLLHWTKGSCE